MKGTQFKLKNKTFKSSPKTGRKKILIGYKTKKPIRIYILKKNNKRKKNKATKKKCFIYINKARKNSEYLFVSMFVFVVISPVCSIHR